jgi:hypothetical protein
VDGQDKLCVDITQATVKGPNGGFNGIGPTLVFSVKGAIGSQFLRAPSAGSTTSKPRSIKPDKPQGFSPFLDEPTFRKLLELCRIKWPISGGGVT